MIKTRSINQNETCIAENPLVYLTDLPWFKDTDILEFFGKVLKVYGFKKNATTVISTTDPANFLTIKNQTQSLVINMHCMNDARHINQMLISMRNALLPGGIIAGCVSPLDQDYARLRSKMPHFLFVSLYPIHFLIFRILPKLPVTGYLYEYFTRGRGRYISKAEMFGRLGYYGFTVLQSKLLNYTLYFFARLDKTIATTQPSFGPLIRLKRVGLHGERITIYKLRTMHPYSEFIQEDIFKQHDLEQTGKIKDDFRITTWGRILRKLWIDELPQLYNWIRGDVSLVGVRALSEHYFSLYPKDLQELRIQFKPGLVPPYYADMPENFEGIIESERKYLDKKKAKPFSTDFIYFLEALMNIVFRGARSS